jgi:antitoxin (DNA-binding transcriptional repressor) of toxin-antitoxin stability system
VLHFAKNVSHLEIHFQDNRFSERRSDDMKKLSIRETRQSLSHLDRLLAVEGEVMITRRGEAIARVVQIAKKRSIPSHRNLRERMPRLRKGSEKMVREDRDAR